MAVRVWKRGSEENPTKRIVTGIALMASLALMAANVASAQDVRTIPDGDIHVTTFRSMKYPSVARFANIQGVVVVRLFLDSGGNVIHAEALSGAPLLIRETVKNAREWRFTPNKENAAVLVYVFSLSGLCAQDRNVNELIFHPPNLSTITTCQATVETSTGNRR
ncbi:MAG: energy transducer TonB [Candidatus Acidiferrales bacterium]